MVDPVTLGTVALVGSVAGGVVGGIGASEAAGAQAASSQYKAGVALLNKQINQQNAAWAMQAGETQAEISGIKSGQQIAETKVQQAASGLDVNTGTVAQVRADQTTISAFEQNTIRWNAAKEAYGYETKAAMNQGESGLDQAAAQDEKTAGEFAMASSFINAGTSVASKWSQAMKTGAFG